MTRFEWCVERIIDLIEGGLSTDPLDRGGLTKYGISQRAYPLLDIAALIGAGVDGILGPLTLRAVQRMGTRETGALFMTERAFDYAALAQYTRYGHGWMKRLFIVAGEA